MDLLHAAPYAINGTAHPGKIHGIRESERSYCGQELRYTGGEIKAGDREDITCGSCKRSLDSKERWEQQREKWEQQEAARQAELTRKDREWWTWYNRYLESPAWHNKRLKVLERAAMLCEGCRLAPPVHVHHLTYEHVGDELLYELVALCVPCHQKAHPHKEITSAKTLIRQVIGG